jgi:immunity protein 10 of polymorphic toxin system
MTPNFHAGHVSIDDMGEYLLVGLADNEVETRDYLMLQRAYAFDEQDRELGMADVYIERNDQGCSGYGGIERFELLPDKVRVRFDDHGTLSMAGIREMEVTFEKSRFEELRAALRQCFEGFQYYSENVA